MIKKSICVLASFGLAACAHKPVILPTPRLVYTCPSLPVYSNETMTKAYSEISEHGKEVPALLEIVKGDSVLRDAVRECQKDAAMAMTGNSLN